MAKRYYDYETLCEAMHDVVLGNGAKHRCIDEGMILELPQADVVEAKRGIWIGEKGSTQFSCSMCGTELYSRIGSARWKFCPECGSRNEPQYNGGATR